MNEKSIEKVCKWIKTQNWKDCTLKQKRDQNKRYFKKLKEYFKEIQKWKNCIWMEGGENEIDYPLIECGNEESFNGTWWRRVIVLL